jgi:hypothetical protein
MGDQERPGEQGIRGRGLLDDETEGHADRSMGATERDDAPAADEVSESDKALEKDDDTEGQRFYQGSDRRIKVNIKPVIW